MINDSSTPFQDEAMALTNACSERIILPVPPKSLKVITGNKFVLDSLINTDADVSDIETEDNDIYDASS